MDYDLVFDAANSSYTIWDSIHEGILFIIFGIALNVSSTLQSMFIRGFSEKVSKRVAKFVLGFAIIFTLMSFTSYTDSNRAKSASLNNCCKTVEGPVENYQLYDAAESEKFEVEGVSFNYSDFSRTGGFDTTATKGGPISEGLNVRICYISPTSKRSNIIVRLELKK